MMKFKKSRIESNNTSSSKSSPPSSTDDTKDIFKVIAKLHSADEKALKIRRTQSTKSIAQSNAARCQVEIFSHLMECRILLQKATGNLPLSTRNHQTVDTINESSVDNNKTQTKLCDQLLYQLLHVRDQMMIRSTLRNDDDVDDKNDFSRMMDLDESVSSSIDEKLERDYKSLKNQWKDVLNKNHAQVQLTSGLAIKAGSKFKVVDQTFWDQVQSTVNHDRFLHATSQIQIQGTQDTVSQQQHNPTITNQSLTSSRNHSILLGFDDTKTYQHLLQDFISSRVVEHQQGSNSIVDAAAERLRRSMKKKSRGQGGVSSTAKDIDRRASKGRKIRYVTHEKLIHFTYPTSRPVAMIEEDVLFKSLFGGGNIKG